MSGSFHSYKTPPSGVNFEFDVEKYGNSYGKVAGVGCDGTKSGVDATLPKYSSPFIVGGSTGYSFTDVPVGPVAGPNAPYSEIEKYDNTKVKYRNEFAPEFPSLLTGGKYRKRTIQYGCNKKTRGGKKHKTRKHPRSKHIRSKHIRSKRLRSKRLRSVRRRTMRSNGMRRRKTHGGMSSASDYTQGRDTSQDQPYGNKAYSFGQGLSSMLSANESALASPPPFLPYNDCGKYTRH